jgi:serine/threonine-protein kinase
MTSIVGTTISGRYSVERLLGEGGMGAVYAAEHTLMHKRVAIKVLHAEMSQMSEVVSRFEREAMAASRIEHPNVAAATDFGKLDDGSFFLVLELVEGKSLREAITAGAFSVRRAMHVAKQIASALQRAHGLGIVHRDLKPENVMLVVRDDDHDFVKVLDFGIAKVPVADLAPKSTAGEALTRAGMIYGTPEYMPPEQALGEEVDKRADFYALGVILYEMLAQKRPFDDESKVKLLGKHINAPVPALPRELQIPAELEALVDKMLAKATSDRVQDAREVIDALDAITASTSPPPAVVSGGFVPIPTSQPSLPSLPSLNARPVVTNPTVLALDAHAKSLARDVTRILPPKVMIASAVVIGVAAFVAMGAMVLKESGPSVGASSSSLAPSASADKHDPRFDREIKKAQNEIAAMQWDQASAHARALQTEDPTRPEPYRIAFQADAAKGDVKLALGDASAWLSVDPTAQTDSQLRELVKTAAQSHENEGAAFALLESGKMGPQGADFLYDLAYGASASGATQAHARHALAHEDATKRASTELRIALDLRNAKDCEAKKSMLDRAATEGDARALTIMETFSGKNGCGFLGMRDCNACMHKDDALARATEKLRARISP